MKSLARGMRVRVRPDTAAGCWVEGYVVRVAEDGGRAAIVLDDYVRVGDRVLMGVLSLDRIAGCAGGLRMQHAHGAGEFEVAPCN